MHSLFIDWKWMWNQSLYPWLCMTHGKGKRYVEFNGKKSEAESYSPVSLPLQVYAVYKISVLQMMSGHIFVTL